MKNAQKKNVGVVESEKKAYAVERTFINKFNECYSTDIPLKNIDGKLVEKISNKLQALDTKIVKNNLKSEYKIKDCK